MMRTYKRVQEPDRLLANSKPGIIDERENAADDGRGCARAEDEVEGAVDADHVVGAVRGEVGEAAGLCIW